MTVFANANLATATTSNFNALCQLEGAQNGKATIALAVVDAAGTAAISGAKISTTPSSGKYVYMNNSGQPFATNGTNTDGLGFAFNAPTGAVTVTASKTGMTFNSTSVTARADTMTITLVTAQ